MVEVLNSPFIVDAAGTFSCYECYRTGNRSEIRFEPKRITVDIRRRTT